MSYDKATDEISRKLMRGAIEKFNVILYQCVTHFWNYFPVGQDGGFYIRPSHTGGSSTPFTLMVYFKQRIYKLRINDIHSKYFVTKSPNLDIEMAEQMPVSHEIQIN
jgi:hypothetical protein